MKKLFFPCTATTVEALTGAFDFLWPTAAAIWNLRWQVRGLVDASPKIEDETLLGRFVNGSGIHGVNLKRSCLDQTWEQQQEKLAEFLLISSIAFYEGWCEQVLHSLGSATDKNLKALQYPTKIDVTGTPTKGVTLVIQSLTASDSPMLTELLHPNLIRHPKHSLKHLENYLLCFRFFKEIRNCLIHNGGCADQKCVDAHVAFLPVATASALGVKECPNHIAPTLDQNVKLSLRGVVGLTDIIRRLVVTLDSELARSSKAEAVFIERWRLVHGGTPVKLPKESTKRRNKMMECVKALGWHPVVAATRLDGFLRTHNLAN